MSINNFIAKSHRVNAAEGLNQTLLTSGITFRKIQQRPLPAQWSTDGWTTATQCCTARRLRIWTSLSNACRTPPRESYQGSDALTAHATPIRADPHWSPIKYRIQYKVAVIVHKVLTTQEQSYLTDVIMFHVSSRHLRSCDRNLLQKDRTNLVVTDRSFSQATPTVWNNLPRTACYLRPFQSKVI